MNYFPDEISQIIVSYALTTRYKIRDEIDIKKLEFLFLSKNPSEGAAELLLLPDNRYKINKNMFSINPSDEAVDFIFPPTKNSINLLMNPNDRVVDFLLSPEGVKYRDDRGFMRNTNDEAVEFIIENHREWDRVAFEYFSQNSNHKAVEFLLRPENRDRISWVNFSENSNDKAVEFLLLPENKNNIKPNAFFWEIVTIKLLILSLLI